MRVVASGRAQSRRRKTLLGASPISRYSLLTAVLLASVSAPALAQQVTLQPYDPLINDAQVGAQTVAAGASLTITGPQLFATGDSGERDTTLGALVGGGRVSSGTEWIGAGRLDPGAQNFGVVVPDPVTGGTRVISTYATANLVALTPVSNATTVPDYVNVNGQQYIDMRVGTVTSGGGTLNVNIGTAGAAPTAGSNAFTVAAKQSSLFFANGTGGAASTINWNSNNRIGFVGEAIAPLTTQNFDVSHVSTCGGTFSVTTADGITTTHTVNDDASLRTYNDWLIGQMQSGNLDPAQYNANFDKAYTSSAQTIGYTASADAPGDEIAQPIGDRIVIHLVGASATGTIASGATLEVSNANNGAIRAEAGGQAINNGTLSTIHDAGDGTAMFLTGSGTTGQNNGVINGNFFLASGGGITNSALGSNVVDVADGASFGNAGILNLATGAADNAGASVGIRLGAGTQAASSGFINVGVTGSLSDGSLTGVLVNDPTAAFTNTGTGLIYIGRGPQTGAAQTPADIVLNQSALTAGIAVVGNAMAINQGTITIGTLTQNAAGISVAGGMNANVTNSGTINVNGKAGGAPRENDGILVANSGGVLNSGTINLNGVNGVGIKVLSTGAAASSAASTGVINVGGGADPGNGTHNFGVWVEGQGAGTATADLGGAVNLVGDGAIGIHARGRATVDVDAATLLTFSSGANQIGFFADGPDAKINLAGSALSVTTTGSTLFRVEDGADFDGTGLTLTASGQNSVAVIGAGAGSVVSTQNAVIHVSGTGAAGVIVEGGAAGTIDAATSIDVTAAGIGVVADGQRTDINGALVGTPVATALTNNGSVSGSGNGAVGLAARNTGTLVNNAAVDMTGAGSAGVLLQSGATLTNNAGGGSIAGATGVLANSGPVTISNTGAITGTAGHAIDLSAAGAASTVNQQNGLISGDILLSAAADTVNVTGGAIAGNIVGQGSANLNFTLGGGAFTLDAAFAIKGMAGVTLNSGAVGIAGELDSDTLTVNGGTLIVDGVAASHTVTVKDGATLGGSGTVGAGNGSLVTVAAGGTIAAGNAIGTLTIAGDIGFAAGSTYVVEVDPAGADSDLIHATGKASLGGANVVHVGLDGAYNPSSTYTILTADGGVDGEFGGVTSDFAFLTPHLTYDTNDVFLRLNRNETYFTDVADTRNQKATAGALESLDGSNPLYDAIVTLPNDDTVIRAAFDALSGEIHASAKSALIEDSHFVRDAVNSRIRSAFGDVTGSDMPLLGYGPDGAQPAAADSTGLVAWAQAFGAWGSFDGDGNAAGMDTTTGGFFTGIDGEVASDIRLGLLAGYSRTTFDVDGRASSGSSDNWHLGLYGGAKWNALRLSGGLAYTWHDIETSRSVAFPGFADSLGSDHSAGLFQAFGEAGYRIDTASSFAIEPFANLALVSLHTDGFSEDGGAAALDVYSGTTDTIFTTLGIHLSSAFEIGGMKAEAHGTLGWRHAFGDTTPLSTQAFAGSDAFTVAGVPIAKDAALIEAGLDLDLTDAATLGLAYQGQFGGGSTENGFSAKLDVRF